MKNTVSRYVAGVTACLAVVASALALPSAAFAQDTVATVTNWGAFAAAITMGLGVVSGTYAQGRAVSTGLEAIGRNPAAAGKLFVPMLIGLAFVESLVILSFVIALQLQ